MAGHDWSLRQFSDSISHATMTRRGFVMTTLVAGFALAMRPIAAETIANSTSSLFPA